jgi:hypothetical protein
MLLGEDKAKVDNGAVGTTIEATPYTVDIDGRLFAVYDTAGLNEAEQGSVDSASAVKDIWNLLRSLEQGISLLVYVVKQRLSEQAKKNYEMFYNVLCQGSVKMVLVITHLDTVPNMDDWWEQNQVHFKKHGIQYEGYACVIAHPGKLRDGKPLFQDEYNDSKPKLKYLVQNHVQEVPWSFEMDSWFKKVVVGFFNLGFIEGNATLLYEALCANGMNPNDARKVTRKAIREVRTQFKRRNLLIIANKISR